MIVWGPNRHGIIENRVGQREIQNEMEQKCKRDLGCWCWWFWWSVRNKLNPPTWRFSPESKISSTLFESRLHEKDKSHHYHCTFIVDLISISRTSIGRVLKRYLASLSKCSTYAEHLGSSKTLNSFHYWLYKYFGHDFPRLHSWPHVLLKDFFNEVANLLHHPSSVSNGGFTRPGGWKWNPVLRRCIYKYKDSRSSLLWDDLVVESCKDISGITFK